MALRVLDIGWHLVPLQTGRLRMQPRDPSQLLQLNDPLLAPLIEAESDDARRDAIEQLIVDRGRDAIRRVISRYTSREWTLREQDAEDLAAAVVLRLLRKLQAVPLSADDAIERFEDYVATLTFNAVHDYLRHRFPERTRLKNQLRYIVAHDSRFAAWRIDGETICGFAAWAGRADVATLPVLPSDEHLRRGKPADSIAAMLELTAAPISLGALTNAIATSWKLPEPLSVEISPTIADGQPTQLEQVESRQFLAALWREILELRVHQRAALLLNLRDADGVNAVPLLVLLGVASLDEIAAALEMPITRLADVWNDLPIDDLRIAAMLGLSRQQIINLRKSARERLGRRLRIHRDTKK